MPQSDQGQIVRDLSVYIALFRSFGRVHHLTKNILERVKEVVEEEPTDILEHEILRYPLM
jgi:hypothetical protein